MPKRSCPFSANNTQFKTHVDMRHVGKEDYAKEVYLKTTEMLMAGAREARKEELKISQQKKKVEESRGKVNIGPVFKVLKEKSGCYFCKHKDINFNPLKPLVNSLNCCSYCNKNICQNTCSKDCGYCGYTFCPSCCEISYGHSTDVVLCINCSADNFMS